MKNIIHYFTTIFKALSTLVQGMSVTGKYFFSPRTIVTEQYPENRNKKGKKKHYITDRAKGELHMFHNELNQHRCTACGICELNCPNGTIEVIAEKVKNTEGKLTKELDKYVYRMGMCTFCNLCVSTCPSNALFFGKEFENAVFDRSKLTTILNQPNSKLNKDI